MSVEDKLKERFGSETLEFSQFRHNRRAIVPVEKFLDVMSFLKTELGFNYLADIAGIDYLNYPNAKHRYGVVYALANVSTAERFFVKVLLDDPEPLLPSVYELWKGADWMEREVYDMFGVVFDGHPDLRRILMPEGFASFPLRKDYPLRGRGERHNFAPIIRAEA
ncbi:MAG: NADH-quinone oxidoreductase subunit C [Gemmataceae bacterium]|jgi:NADH-quinone oxidoreductase subunit C|nr:NADH-quinone oxidoreductase subunit C [Gemmataceae bacterium]